MPPIPKPSKKDRELAEQERKRKLKEYRKSQASLAVFRDDGMCAICHFRYHRDRRMDDVHHVFGRGRNIYDPREQFTSLLCVCRECHPQPIMYPGGNPILDWVEDVLRLANVTPINTSFHED